MSSFCYHQSIIAIGILVVVLHDCLFVPDSRKNLVSVSKFCNDIYSVSFNKTFSIMKENEVVTCGTLMNNLYHIDCVAIQVNNVEKFIEKKRA